MTNKLKGGAVIVSLALIMSVVGFTGTAGAATRPPLERARAQCNKQIDQRINGLTRLRARIEQFRHLEPAQKTQLISSVNDTIAELNGRFRAAVNAATTRTSLRAACSSVVVDLRIYMVFIPQVVSLASIESLTNGEAALQTRVDQLAADGVDTSAMQALLDEAAATLETVEATTLAITPASFNADPAGTWAQWQSVRTGINEAFADLVGVLRLLQPSGSAAA